MALTSAQLAKIGIAYAPDFNDEENPTITIFNNSGVKLREWSLNLYIVDSGGSYHYLEWRDLPLDTTSYTFVLTDSERDILRTYITGQNDDATFYLSFIDSSGTSYSKYYTVLLSIKYARPTISMTVVDDNSSTVALTGSNSKFIRYFSNAKYTVNATAYKKATIKSCSITNGSKTVSSQSGTFLNISDPMIQVDAIDSRGFGNSIAHNLSMIYYVKLTCYLDITNITGDGKATLNISGMYFNESFGSANNTLTVYYRRKTEGGSYGNWIAVTPTVNRTSYSASISLSDFNYKSGYTFQAKAVDKLMEISSVEKTIRGTPVFDWSKDDFNFNVPVTHQDDVTVKGNANLENDLIVGGSTEFQGNATFIGNADIQGGATIADSSGGIMLSKVAQYLSDGIDPNTTLDSMILTHINTPSYGTFYYIRTEFYASRSASANRMQIAYPYRWDKLVYFRTYYNSEWSDWSIVGSFSYPYSEEHVNTGDFWNDGTNIYRYVTEKEVTSTGTNVTIDYIGTTVNVISVRGVFMRTGGSTMPINFYYSSSNYNNVWVDNDGNIIVRTSTAGTARVIIDYAF